MRCGPELQIGKTLAENTESKVDGLESLTFSNRHCFQLEGGAAAGFPLFKSYMKPCLE